VAADSSTLADEYIASPHRNSDGTEHRLNIELPDHPLSCKGPVETEEPAPAVRTHVEEITPVMADNVDATVPVRMSTPEYRFRGLIAFRGLPDTKANLCRVALEEWQASKELNRKRVAKTEKEIRSTRNEIYQVVGFYSAFQGLLLTAVAQSNLLHWNNRGYPLALSAFATGVAAIGVVLKNKLITDLKKTLDVQNREREVPVLCLSLVQGPPWVVPLFWYGLDLRRYLAQKNIEIFSEPKEHPVVGFLTTLKELAVFMKEPANQSL